MFDTSTSHLNTLSTPIKSTFRKFAKTLDFGIATVEAAKQHNLQCVQTNESGRHVFGWDSCGFDDQI